MSNPAQAAQAPFTKAAAVTKSDTDVLSATVRGLYIGGAGDVAVILREDSSAVTFKAVPVGTTLWIAPAKVMSTNTSATLILALS